MVQAYSYLGCVPRPRGLVPCPPLSSPECLQLRQKVPEDDQLTSSTLSSLASGAQQQPPQPQPVRCREAHIQLGTYLEKRLDWLGMTRAEQR